MKKQNKFIISLFLGLWMTGGSSNATPLQTLTLQNDTIEVEDNPYTQKGKKYISATDSATNARLKFLLKEKKSGMDFVLDRRYRAEGDSMHGHWYDNVFLYAGAGVEQMVPPANNYHFNALSTASLGIGIQLGQLNTIRLSLHGALGYQQDYDRVFGRASARLEHLFDLTSYFDGYQPTRLLSVSTLLGAGGQYASLNNTNPKRSGLSWEGHGGLQLRFYTGPHGYLDIEPYAGLATDKADLSQSQNWHRYDVFYGANINYVYYLTNHLTRAARQREIRKSDVDKRNFLTKDSLLQSWQAPWFFEFSLGANATDAPDLDLTQTLGRTATISVGKWFSPVIGLRASAAIRNAVWREETDIRENGTFTNRIGTQYAGCGIEALFNPFGLSRNYIWDQKTGFYLLAGGEYGWFIKHQTRKSLHCHSEAYTAGLHIYVKLSDGLRAFAEPRYVHNVYKIPYSNVDWNQRFSENNYSVNVGLTVTQTAPTFRQPVHENAEELHRFTIGIGGGINMVEKLSKLDASHSFPLSLSGTAVYRFDHISGIRLGLDYMLIPSTAITSFTDYNMQVPDLGYAPVVRQGLWNHTYYFGQATLGYHMNLTNALAGYKPNRLFCFEPYLGIGIASVLGEGGQLDTNESLRENHEVRLTEKTETSAYFTIVGGTSLSFRLTPFLSLSLMPQITYTPHLDLPAIRQTRLRVTETLNLGIQYDF